MSSDHETADAERREHLMSMTLYGLAEIAEILGLEHKQNAWSIMNEKGAPDPLEKLAMGRVWDGPVIRVYLRPRLERRAEREESRSDQ